LFTSSAFTKVALDARAATTVVPPNILEATAVIRRSESYVIQCI